MKQIVKRILTFALSAAMVLTLVPTTAFAEDTGSNKVNKNLRVSGTSDADLEVGKTYSIPLVKYGEDGNTKDWASVDYKGQDILDNSALVEKNSDGTYKVTLSWANYQYFDMIQFMKPGTIEDGTSAEDIKMGTYNIPDTFVINSSMLNTANQKYDFTTILRDEVLRKKQMIVRTINIFRM